MQGAVQDSSPSLPSVLPGGDLLLVESNQGSGLWWPWRFRAWGGVRAKGLGFRVLFGVHGLGVQGLRV